MNKKHILGAVIAVGIILSGCAPSKPVSEHIKHAKQVTEADIFKSSKENEKLEKSELDASIKKYIKVNNQIEGRKIQIQQELDKQSNSKEKVTKEQKRDLIELEKNAEHNQRNFLHYFRKNTLPDGYKDNLERLTQYYAALNTPLDDVEQKIKELNYSPKNSINVVDVPTQFVSDVNGKTQEKIKVFLKEQHIDTSAFEY